MLTKYFAILLLWAYIIYRTENPSELAYLENFTSLIESREVLLPNVTTTAIRLNYDEQDFDITVNGTAPIQLGSGVLASFGESVLNMWVVAQIAGVSAENLTRVEAERIIGGDWVCTALTGGSNGTYLEPVYPDVHFTWPVASIFFTMTVFTTIGYGSYAPGTYNGKLLMVPMAVCGLWITAAAITSFLNLFQFTTDRIVAMHPRVCGRFGKVLCTTAVMLVMLNLLCQGLKHFEDWADWEARYFAWISMTTIGFGDFCPQSKYGQVLTLLLAIMFVGLFPFWIQTCMECGKDLCHRNSDGEVPAYEVTLKLPVTELNFHGQDGWVWLTTEDGEQFRVQQSWFVHAPDELLVAMDPDIDITKAENVLAPAVSGHLELSSERVVNM